MSKAKAKKAEVSAEIEELDENFAGDLIKALNKELGTRIAYNLLEDDAPTLVKRWISTGSRLLDYCISNRRYGGLPEGRIIELFGPPSTGKSHIALQVCRNTQRMGGVVVYIDTENATSLDNLHSLGVDVSKRFVFIETSMTEEVFSVIESTILKAKSMAKDVPITIVWDSIAATSPKAELEGSYDQTTIGLQARVISKGMRKLTGVLGNNNVTLLCLNQTRSKIGVMFGDPTTTPGGVAIPFHASVRLSITGGSAIKNKEGEAVGIGINVTVKKDKVAPPHRKAEMQIHFGKGIVEHEQILDIMRTYGAGEANGKSIEVAGDGTWKTLTVKDVESSKVILTKKFTKNDFATMLDDPETQPYLDDLLEVIMVRKSGEVALETAESTEDSYDE